MSRGSSFRISPWICWGLIVSSWAVLAATSYHALAEFERVIALLPPMPPFPEPPKPPDVLIAIACGVAALFLATTLSRSGRAWLRMRPRLSRRSKHGHIYLEAFTIGPVLTGAVSFVIVCWYWQPLIYLVYLGPIIAICYAFRRTRAIRVPLAEWGCTRGRAVWREVSIGIGLGLCAKLVQYLPVKLESVDTASLLLSLAWAPIFEETLFRGMLYRYLRDHWRWPVAVLISSVLFAVVHLPHQRWPYVFVMGVVYALLREWRGSLLAPIAAHAVGNLLAVLTRSGTITW